MIPGLGADRRMYAPQLKVFPEAVVLEHLPAKRGESIADYAQRFVPRIDTTTPFVVVGSSLGGIISMELSRLIQPEKIILLASVKNRKEMPHFIRSMRYLKLHKPIKGGLYKRAHRLLVHRLSNRGEAEMAGVITEMLMDTPSEFFEWAIDAVIHWQPPVEYSSNIIHIHGTNDTLFPYSRINHAIPVKNGSHILNLTMSHEVNRILKEVIY
jgi:hypothetical protein